MSATPIICNGYELESVLADIRERKGFPDSLEAGFGGHNAQYRVNYFATTETILPVTSPPIDEAGKSPEGPGRDGNKPLMQNRTANDAPSPTGITGGDPFPHQCETPASLFATVAVKRAAAPRNELNDSKIPCYGSAVSTGLCPDSAQTVGVETHLNAGKEPMTSAGKSPRGSDQVTPEEITCQELASGGERQTESRVEDCHQHSPSIETRMAALQEKLSAAGKLKRNKPREARLPHPND